MLLVGELAARHLGFGHPLIYKASPAGYELVPDQTVVRLGKTVHINNAGTRGPDIAPVPAVGTDRMMVRGDSVANGGTQMNDAQTWPLQWAARLTRQGRKVEVVNASAEGWAIGNEAAWLDEHGLLGARLVLLEVNEKDLDQGFAGRETLDRNVSFPSHPPFSGLSEITFRYVLPRLGLGAPTADPGSTDGVFQPANTAPMLANVEHIRQRVEAGGARLAILYWDVRLPASAPAAAARDRLLTYAAQHQIQVVRPNLREDHYFRDDIHPNVEGNQRIADTLAANLRLP